jgi:hypothetical protein
VQSYGPAKLTRPDAKSEESRLGAKFWEAEQKQMEQKYDGSYDDPIGHLPNK